jgi:hypothetical protein
MRTLVRDGLKSVLHTFSVNETKPELVEGWTWLGRLDFDRLMPHRGIQINSRHKALRPRN